MPKKEYDAYSLFCKSLDTLGSALAFGSSIARAAAKANEELARPWEFPDQNAGAEGADGRGAEQEKQVGPSAIEEARDAVARRIEELTGVPATESAIVAEAEKKPAAEPEAAPPVAAQEDTTDPAATTQQADELDGRAKRLLARFVEPDPDFFEKSPFEGWDAFDETSQKPN
ncbi:MAG: hypothetical protein AAGA39_06310 [Pseudomonadota bacterium]